MWGPALFLATILLIQPQSRAVMEMFVGETQGRFRAEAPFSYAALLISLIACLIVCLILAMWPRNAKPVEYQVILRFPAPNSHGYEEQCWPEPNSRQCGAARAALRWLLWKIRVFLKLLRPAKIA